MTELARRAKVMIGGAAALGFLGMASLALFFYNPQWIESLLSSGTSILLWIVFLVSPGLWLELSIPWALGAGPPVRRAIRFGACLIFPTLVLLGVVLVRAYPDSFDTIVRPISIVWMTGLAVRGLHVYWRHLAASRAVHG